MNNMGMPVLAPVRTETAAVAAPARPEVPAAPRPAEGERFATDVEQWLRHEVKPEAPVVWRPWGRDGDAVSGADDLAVRVASLAEVGAWAVVSRARGSTWGQCLRVERGWIVEVNGIPGPDCFVRRVRRADVRVPGMRRRAWSNGNLMAIYEPGDVVPTPAAVADILWSWLRGALPAGFVLAEIPV